MVGSRIQGGLDLVPGIEGLWQQHLFLQVNEFVDTGDQVPAGEQQQARQIPLVNGQYQPTISIQPGETQRWSISNASANNIFLLALAGHQLHQIAKDGNPFHTVVAQDQILLAPAERVEVLVQAQNMPGTLELRQLLWGEGVQAEPDRLLATMVIEGDSVPVAPLPPQLIPFNDLRELAIDNERVILFSPVPPPYYQWIDTTPFDPDGINQTVQLGTMEKWTIQNTTEEVHPFHIHLNESQVISVNGEPVDAPSLSDTVSVPAFGEVKILHRFEDFTGKFVYHCHILMHEDAGMMAVVEVVP